MKRCRNLSAGVPVLGITSLSLTSLSFVRVSTSIAGWLKASIEVRSLVWALLRINGLVAAADKVSK